MNGPPLVVIDQPAWAGAEEVVEDSRCPENARCHHAGRLVISTRSAGAD